MVRGRASVAEQPKVVAERGLHLQRWVEPERPEPVGAILNQQRSLSHDCVCVPGNLLLQHSAAADW
jgi:hypothetical protein